MSFPIQDIIRCCRSGLRRLPAQERGFNSTPARRKHGAVPYFHPTENPTLDTTLAKFRANIMVPAHLIQLQKQLVYKRSNWHLLTNPDEPATVRMGNEVHQLHPLDRTVDEPNTQKTFHKILDLMQRSGDWRNLPFFLEGLKSARRNIDGAMWQKLARKAIEAGQTGIVLDCIRRVETTGFSLSDPGIAKEVMFGATARAIQGEWSEEAVNKAAQYADNTWEEIWNPRHSKIGDGSPRMQPEIIGILAQIHAAKVVMFGAGEEEVRLVEKYGALMLKHWENANLAEVTSLVENGEWNQANLILVFWCPVWHAMKMARTILGGESPLAKALGDKSELELEPLLQESRVLLENKAPSSPGKRRGLVLFEELSTLTSS